jgi:hypothetical protein
MSTTALIEPSPRDTQLDTDDLLAGLPPLLTRVPVAGPPVWVLVGFGGVLLLLLVPPLTLVVTLMAVALLGALAVVALVALAVSIVAAPFLLIRRVRELRLPRVSLAPPVFVHVRNHQRSRA